MLAMLGSRTKTSGDSQVSSFPVKSKPKTGSAEILSNRHDRAISSFTASPIVPGGRFAKVSTGLGARLNRKS